MRVRAALISRNGVGYIAVGLTVLRVSNYGMYESYSRVSLMVLMGIGALAKRQFPGSETDYFP